MTIRAFEYILILNVHSLNFLFIINYVVNMRVEQTVIEAVSLLTFVGQQTPAVRTELHWYCLH